MDQLQEGNLCLTFPLVATKVTNQGLQPPERFMTTGAVGSYLLFPQLLDDLDLLRDLEVKCTGYDNSV